MSLKQHSCMLCLDGFWLRLKKFKHSIQKKLHRFRNDQPIDELPSARHIVTPENDPEQSLYTCRGIRSGRPSYSETSDHLTTKNLREYNRALKVERSSPRKHCLIPVVCFWLKSVVLKRRVLLAISGCILFGIAVIFLGCIILRVIRKPGFSLVFLFLLFGTFYKYVLIC